MRLLRAFLALIITAITLLQLSKNKPCHAQQAGGDLAYETPSELEVAVMLLNFGKWFLIVAAVWIILFV